MQAFGVALSAFDSKLACAPAPPALRAALTTAGSFRRGRKKPAARSSTPPPPDASPLASPARLDGESLRPFLEADAAPEAAREEAAARRAETRALIEGVIVGLRERMGQVSAE